MTCENSLLPEEKWKKSLFLKGAFPGVMLNIKGLKRSLESLDIIFKLDIKQSTSIDIFETQRKLFFRGPFCIFLTFWAYFNDKNDDDKIDNLRCKDKAIVKLKISCRSQNYESYFIFPS